jgi:hypothetical protein
MHDRVGGKQLALAKRAIADLLNYRNRPTYTKHDKEITMIPQIAVKQGRRRKAVSPLLPPITAITITPHTGESGVPVANHPDVATWARGVAASLNRLAGKPHPRSGPR